MSVSLRKVKGHGIVTLHDTLSQII